MADQRFGMALFWERAQEILDRVVRTQSEQIRRAAEVLADCIEHDGVAHAYGTGHSTAFAMELANRAGGLVPMDRMDLRQLVPRAGWPPEKVFSPDIERDPEAGPALLTCHKIYPQDIFIIASNSGIYPAIVDVAQQVKAHGHTLIAVTSMEHSQRMSSRAASGKKLYELADIVIDNCGPYGDALLEMPNGKGRACSISSLTGALIGQMLTAETIGILLDRGYEPPVLLSANVTGGLENNAALQEKYAGRIE
ncbi:MAG: sugar isomerase domain-containing protein [Nitrososphaerota archaeon]